MNVSGLNANDTTILATVIAVILLLFCASSDAAQKIISGMDLRGMSDINPHWDKDKCGVCHENDPGVADGGLKTEVKDELCIHCHAEDVVHKYIHPSGLSIPKSYQQRIEKYWPQKMNAEIGERITCNTCHDVLDQCLPSRSYMSGLNPKFLRGGPYARRFDICYKCHDPEKYRGMNSHEQIDAAGNLKLNKCRLCHEFDDSGSIKKGIKRDMGEFPLLKDFAQDRSLLCLRCHKKIDHPTSAFKFTSLNEYRHFIKITDKKRKTLELMKTKTGIDLPLEPVTDRIYCGTCHEPHQVGVFKQGAGDSDSLAPNRLRVKKICVHCHDK